MGQIRSDEGAQDEAINWFIDALRWDPMNAAALLMMGNILARHKRDIPAALIYYNQALLVNTDDYISFTNIGYLLLQQGNSTEAKRYLNVAREIKPDYPNVHLALSMLAQKEQNDHAAFACVVQAVRLSRKKDELYQRAVQQAFDTANRCIASGEGINEVNEFRHRLEFEGEKEIEAVEDNSISTPAKFEFAENYNRPNHIIRYKPAYPAVEHLMLHELVHLKLANEARREGTNQLFTAQPEHRTRFVEHIAPTLHNFRRRGFDPQGIDHQSRLLFDGLNNQIFNTPIDLFIEDYINKSFPAMRPYQFVSLHGLLREGIQGTTDKTINELMQKDLISKSKILNLVNALQFRELYGIDLTGEFKATPAELKQAQIFYDEFLEYRDDRQPAEEYELVAHWAEDLKMNGFFELVGETQYRKRSNLNSFLDSLEKDPLGLDERDPVQEREMRRFLEAQKRVDVNATIALYMVSALKFFKELPVEQVKKIAIEIAMTGTQGFDPNKVGYAVAAIPGKEFSGYQIMCYMYVAWALAIPEQLLSLGLEWHREWEVAKGMVK